MDELKACPMGAKQAAEKLQESYDYMVRIMPEGKRSQATIDLLAAMLYAINALCRTAPQNNSLTCEGCEHEFHHLDELDICGKCCRVVKYADHYEARKPEQEEK